MDKVWVLEPRKTGLLARAAELWQYRHLVPYFGRRFLEKNFLRTWLGWGWLFIRPLFDVLVGVLIFGGVLNIQTGEVPYFLFYITGMLCWNFFDTASMWATRSLELNRRLITKVYFPRLILPLSAAAPALLNLAIYIVVLAIGAGYYYYSTGVSYITFGPGLLAALGALVLTLIMSVGLGLWTSVPGARARDVRFTLAYVLNFWFFLTPVIYPVESIPESVRWLAMLNPMAMVVETVKWGVLGMPEPSLQTIMIGPTLVVITFISGLWFFSTVERTSVDRL